MALIKFGNVSKVNASLGTCRVEFPDDEIVSHDIPMVLSSTKGNKEHRSYDVGEHVVCLMDCNCENGVVLGAIYDAKNKPGESSEGLVKVNFSDGASVSYDTESSEMEVSIGTIKIKANNSGIEMSKAGDSLGDILGDLISLVKSGTHLAGQIPTLPNPVKEPFYVAIVQRVNNLLH